MKQGPISGQRLLTPQQVAEWLGVSVGWVRDHATRKQPMIPVVRMGKVMRFRHEEIQEFIDKWSK